VDYARRLARVKADEIAALNWDALDRYGRQTEHVEAPDGTRLRVESQAYWDMDDWASGINIRVKVRPSRGWRRFWAYAEDRERGGEDDPVPPRNVGVRS
jgi:hypothetical protein